MSLLRTEPARWRAAALVGLALGALLLASACDDEAPGADEGGDALDAGVDAGEVVDLGPGDAGHPPDVAADAGGDPEDLGAEEDLGSDDLGPEDLGIDQGVDAGEPDDPRVTELVELGKQRLAEARARDALLLFEEALELDADHPDALFGASLAGFIDAVELTAMLTSIFGQAQGYLTRNEFFAHALHDELMKLRQDYVLSLERAELLSPEQVDFEVEAAWLYVGIEPTLVFRGVFDGGDLHLLRATVSMCAATVELLCGQDMNTALLDTVNELRDGMGEVDLANIGRILGLLLNPEPQSFLLLHGEDGEEIFAAAKEHLAAVGRELKLAVDWMTEHHGQDERPQVSRLEDLQDDGSFVLVMRFVATPQEAAEPGEAPPAPVESELRSDMSPELIEAFSHASAAFDQPGELVPYAEEVAPILATLLHTLVQLGLFDDLLGDLPIDVRVLQRAALQQLLVNLLPLPIALDLGTFYSQPVGLRTVLPLVTPDSPARLYAEWECPTDLDERGYPSAVRGILCGPDAELVDGAHFAELAWAMDEDGLEARTPYLVWADPTLNGLLVVDLSGLDVEGWGAPGYRPPTLRELNAALAIGLEPLLGLLAGAL